MAHHGTPVDWLVDQPETTLRLDDLADR